MKDPQYVEALEKMRAWCSRQERSKGEVRTKLFMQGYAQGCIDMVVATLVEDNYVNDHRFAEAFVTGHFRIKKWGRIKIRNGLQQKGIGEQLGAAAIEENIDQQEYETVLMSVLSKKIPISKWTQMDYPSKQKLMQYAYSRGFEPDLIRRMLERRA